MKPIFTLLRALGILGGPLLCGAAPKFSFLFIALDDLNDWIGRLGGQIRQT